MKKEKIKKITEKFSKFQHEVKSVVALETLADMLEEYAQDTSSHNEEEVLQGLCLAFSILLKYILKEKEKESEEDMEEWKKNKDKTKEKINRMFQ